MFIGYDGFIKRLRNYIRTAHRLGISTMPILFNGNGLNPDILKPAYRARGDATVKAVVDALKELKEVLSDKTEVFHSRKSSTDDILEADYCANLLEGCEMVPMIDPSTAKIQAWRAQPPAERDEQPIRKFSYNLGLRLKTYCQIF